MRNPPETEAELLERAWCIAGLTLGELASDLQKDVPDNLLYKKGWIGELLELTLGATAGSKPEPDFQNIGVELKSIPVGINGRVKETTHICTVPMINTNGMTWENSLVREKLKRVLWIPVESDQKLILGDRKIGSPLLWSPDVEEETLLKTDWEEFMEMICLGQIDQITSHLGVVIQIRPKAADSHALTESIGKQGERIQTLPRGFYLRTSFTSKLLTTHYHQVS